MPGRDKGVVGENSKFGQSLQSLLPTVKGRRFASIRGSSVVSCIATAQLLWSYRMGGTHQSTREESEGRNEGSYRSMVLWLSWLQLSDDSVILRIKSLNAAWNSTTEGKTHN